AAPYPLKAWDVVVLLLVSLSLWLICVQAVFRAAGYEFYVTWFPAFLQDGFGATKQFAGDLASAPIIAFVVGSLVGGPLVGFLYHGTGSRRLSRRGTAAAGLALNGLCTLVACWLPSPAGVTAALTLGVFFAGSAGPAAWAATLDIAGRRSALLFGIMNFAGC